MRRTGVSSTRKSLPRETDPHMHGMSDFAAPQVLCISGLGHARLSSRPLPPGYGRGPMGRRRAPSTAKDVGVARFSAAALRLHIFANNHHLSASINVEPNPL
jgi:hypothetical protein